MAESGFKHGYDCLMAELLMLGFIKKKSPSVKESEDLESNASYMLELLSVILNELLLTRKDVQDTNKEIYSQLINLGTCKVAKLY